MANEIERKWMISRLPFEIEEDKWEAIRQTYLYADADGEVRLRKRGHRYFLTMKSSGEIAREEEEVEVSEMSFHLLSKLGGVGTVEKFRATVLLEGNTFEFDRFSGKLDGLLCLELEFRSEEEAVAFHLPNSFAGCGAVEVTTDKRFKNKNLAKMSEESARKFVAEWLL